MKVIFVFAVALLAVNALSTHEQWSSFKANHSKNYQNIVEEKLRFEIFQNNLQKIQEHNARYEAGLETYTLGINKFADMTSEEFKAMLKLVNGPKPKLNARRHVMKGEAPESIDWREKKAVTNVKDQGNCGSCWSFSATGALEGQNYIVHGISEPLSEQQLLDCSGDYGNGDCDYGGLMDNAFNYVIDNGLNTEAEYPYTEKEGTCKPKKSSAVKVKDYVDLENSEEALKNAVGTVGPVSVAMYAEPIQLYFGGIFSSDSCLDADNYLDHGVLAVGYGEENGKPYWIVKNSWGSSWGEDGYFRLSRGKKLCGISAQASYPILG